MAVYRECQQLQRVNMLMRTNESSKMGKIIGRQVDFIYFPVHIHHTTFSFFFYLLFASLNYSLISIYEILENFSYIGQYINFY